jgi:hypothetical protein
MLRSRKRDFFFRRDFPRRQSTAPPRQPSTPHTVTPAAESQGHLLPERREESHQGQLGQIYVTQISGWRYAARPATATCLMQALHVVWC